MNTLSRTGITMILAMLAACGRAPPETSSTQAADAPAAPAAPAPDTRTARTACERVTAEQMSVILGTAMVAEPKSSNECAYTPKAGGGMPLAELGIDLGSAEAAMTASGMLGQMEPGMTSPYEGMGDQASAIGPAVWVRRGDDLIRIMVMGTENHDAAVRRVYELVDKGF